MNEYGLVVALSFGGSREVGDGFGIPLILRYDRKQGASKMKVMQTATTTLRLLGRRFVGNPYGP